MKPELSVIIVNYNGLQYLKGCFDSLHDKLQGINHEIVVIDNNSKDNSCAYIKQHYPEVVLIESKENHGFGKGNNEAVKHAKGEYILLLNNDTILQDNLLPVLKHIKADATIGAVGIKMVSGTKEYLLSVGKFPDFLGVLKIKNMSKVGTDLVAANFTKNSYDVDWISGSFLLMPKKVYDEVGGFDEKYFMYVEDVDLCREICNKGYRRVFLPNYSYVHFVGFNKSKNPLLLQGLKTYINKHYSGLAAIKLKLALTINATVKRFKNIFNLD
ncbi:glycosyltransferase family 2 protein [Flavobacterium litorale]|uniref:Glycosyltransferase family 2 protein n=1 Tax=Flavobacterium litorale TaxID=2856519 RepID=A0ABX8V888_9FLAO|nr:glycosyltransferase family 2 protein [Flavobacterium litorale]QYJ69064.1 glycosyltransferase family 2 protein [Flavobacterium litorale]